MQKILEDKLTEDLKHGEKSTVRCKFRRIDSLWCNYCQVQISQDGSVWCNYYLIVIFLYYNPNQKIIAKDYLIKKNPK